MLFSNCHSWLAYNNEANGYDEGISNSWDNGTHGNFWSDYRGEGDYLIAGSANSTDHPPSLLKLVEILGFPFSLGPIYQYSLLGLVVLY